MALNYLLSPEFQISVTSGKPNTGGWIEVFLAGTQTKYLTACDFNGTKNPFRIPLDSLGQALVLADEGTAYDVFVYNRYGSQLFSRYNVMTAGGGINLSAITSQDGSIIVEPTATGVDLSVKGSEPSALRAVSSARTADGEFVFTARQRTGTELEVSNGRIIVDSGWYHYDVTLLLTNTAAPVNESVQINLTTLNGSTTRCFDTSFQHSETVQVSGEYRAVDDGTPFVVSISGLPEGMVASVYDFGMHSIKGIGGGGGGQFEQVQSDWTESDISNPAYIQHKPDLSIYATQAQVSALQSALIAVQSTVSSMNATITSLQSSLTDLERRYNAHGATYDSTTHRISHGL